MDFSQELTCVLCSIDNAVELATIGSGLLLACQQELGLKACLYFVVDEAQTAVDAWPKAFRDAETGCKSCPVVP